MYQYKYYSLCPNIIVLPPRIFMSQNVCKTYILELKKLRGVEQSFWDGGSNILACMLHCDLDTSTILEFNMNMYT